MNPPTVPLSARPRVARSLVSWWEIPPRSSLQRGDWVRFAHSIATLARQLLAAVNSLNASSPSWNGPWIVAPEEFGRRLGRMVSLSDPAHTERIAESLLDETLDLLVRSGVTQAALRFERLRNEPVPPMSTERARSLSQAVFERARSLTARAVLIADSFARGCADEGSDLDIRLLVDCVPSLAERSALITPFAEEGRVRQYGDEAYITADQFLWCGRKIDVKYHPVARMERALCQPFVLGGPIDLLELVEVHLVVADPEGVVARLAALVGERTARAREIASVSLGALQERVLSRSSSATPVEAVATVLGPGLEYLVRVWTGINGRIHAFPKWVHRIVPELAVRPPNGWDRLLAITTEPWTEETLDRRLAEWCALVTDLAALNRR
jgi:hypothetical protein